MLSGCLKSDKASAGRIVEVLTQQVILDGKRAAGGNKIPAGAVLATDVDGAARFRLEKGGRPCTIFPSSQVAVQPTPEFLLRLLSTSGGFDCGQGGVAATVEAGGTRMELGDSEVAVQVEKGNTEVRVRSGQVQVTSGGDTVNVGPRQATSAPIGKRPSPPVNFDPTRTDLPENILRPGTTTTTVPASTTTTARRATTTTIRRA